MQPNMVPDDRPILWRDIRYGMTVSEVHAIYPLGRMTRLRRHHTEIDNFAIVGDCQAEVNIEHPEGVVVRVLLKGKGAPTDGCPEAVTAALASRYGRPLSEITAARSAYSNGFDLTTWESDGTTIRLSRQVSGSTLGVGLFRGSWEVEYIRSPVAAAL